MKHKVLICAILLTVFSAAAAQVASHAPSNAALHASAGIPSHVPQATTTPTQPITIPQVSGKPVARVNGVVLTDRDLLREMYTIFPYARQHNGFPKEMEPGIRSGALQMIVFEELVYQDAQKRHLVVPAAKVATAKADFRKQFSSPAQYQQFLASEYQGNEKLLTAQIRRSLLIEQSLKAEVESKAVVTTADLRAYYRKNPARFQYPESFAIQTISIIPPEKATPAQLAEARKRADEAYKQAKATKTAEEFGLLAEKLSDDDYRVMLGDHKWVKRDDMPPMMLQPALKMKAGEMSELINVGQNFVVFRMNRHIPAGIMKFEDVKVQLRKELEKSKTNQVRAALDKKLRQGAKVETL